MKIISVPGSFAVRDHLRSWDNLRSRTEYSLSIRVHTTINHISIFTFLCFFTTISTSKKMFSFRARAEKGIARHIDVSDVAGT